MSLKIRAPWWLVLGNQWMTGEMKRKPMDDPYNNGNPTPKERLEYDDLYGPRPTYVSKIRTHLPQKKKRLKMMTCTGKPHWFFGAYNVETSSIFWGGFHQSDLAHYVEVHAQVNYSIYEVPFHHRVILNHWSLHPPIFNIQNFVVKISSSKNPLISRSALDAGSFPGG